jgi:hypothetical protein
MEDGIERNMSLFITELEKKQQITRPKYEDQVHPIGLSLISRTETTPISHQTTPISVIDTTQDITPIRRETTPIGHDNTPIGDDNTPIIRQEACPNTGQETLAKTTPNVPSTNTDSDS